MANPVYIDLYKRGYITREDYHAAVGEYPEPENPAGSAARGQGLDPTGQEAEKINPAQQAAINAKLAELGTDASYKQPTPEELAKAESMASRKLEGTGFKCPRHHCLVTSCPDGDIRQCSAAMRCAYASYEMHRTMGGQYNERLGEDGQPVANPANSSAVGRAASQARGNNALTQQALALMKARERVKRAA